MAEEKKKGSPDIGKGSEIEEGSTSPDIGKGESLDEFDETLAPPETGQGAGGALSTETQEYLKRKGFKSADELVKSHASLEKKQTESAREARLNRLSGLGVPVVQTGDVRPAGTVSREREKIEIPDDPSELLYDKEKFTSFLDRYGKEVEQRTLDKVEAHLGKQEEQKIVADYNELLRKDPEKFEKLRPTMFQLSKRYPDATLHDIYDEAEAIFEEEKKKASDELLRDTFGPDVDRDKLKTLVAKAKPAQISVGAGGGQEITEIVTPTSDVRARARKIKEDILGADKLTD